MLLLFPCSCARYFTKTAQLYTINLRVSTLREQRSEEAFLYGSKESVRSPDLSDSHAFSAVETMEKTCICIWTSSTPTRNMHAAESFHRQPGWILKGRKKHVHGPQASSFILTNRTSTKNNRPKHVELKKLGLSSNNLFQAILVSAIICPLPWVLIIMAQFCLSLPSEGNCFSQVFCIWLRFWVFFLALLICLAGVPGRDKTKWRAYKWHGNRRVGYCWWPRPGCVRCGRHTARSSWPSLQSCWLYFVWRCTAEERHWCPSTQGSMMSWLSSLLAY